LGHGKNRKALEQLIKTLDQYGIPHKEAIEEANRGRPISQKVADTMRECGAAILIFSADEKFLTSDQDEIWRPSENVVHELGAASVLYDNRIVIFKEKTVSLATNYGDIGYIEFEHNALDAKVNELFRELIAFGLIKVTVGQ
jgi:predicted nucleotide-binding protein